MTQTDRVASLAIAEKLNGFLSTCRDGGIWPLDRLFREAHLFCLQMGCPMRYRVDRETFYGDLLGGEADGDPPADPGNPHQAGREPLVFWAWETFPGDDDMVVLACDDGVRARAYSVRDAPDDLAGLVRVIRSLEADLAEDIGPGGSDLHPAPPH